MVVGRPRHRAVIIWKTQALAVMHRPMSLPVEAPAQPKTSTTPALQGLSTLGGGCCHDLFPTLSPIYSPVFRPHQCHLTDTSQDFPDLIGPTDQSRSYQTGPSGNHPIAPQTTIRTPVGVATHNIGDVAAFQDHMIIM